MGRNKKKMEIQFNPEGQLCVSGCSCASNSCFEFKQTDRKEINTKKK